MIYFGVFVLCGLITTVIPYVKESAPSGYLERLLSDILGISFAYVLLWVLGNVFHNGFTQIKVDLHRQVLYKGVNVPIGTLYYRKFSFSQISTFDVTEGVNDDNSSPMDGGPSIYEFHIELVLDTHRPLTILTDSLQISYSEEKRKEKRHRADLLAEFLRSVVYLPAGNTVSLNAINPELEKLFVYMDRNRRVLLAVTALMFVITGVICGAQLLMLI